MSDLTQVKIVIIVGMGSVGQTHFKKVSRFAEKIIIVDPNTSNFIIEKLKNEKVSHYSKLSEVPNSQHIDLGVISNWGPDHMNTFLELDRRGIKRLLIEKPVVSKIGDLYSLKEIIDRRRIALGVNVPWITSGLCDKIEKARQDFSLGSLVSIVVSGGAKCLSTMGIHYMGLACKLFDSSPLSLQSSLNFEEINPRATHLNYVEGVSNWIFSNQRYFQICFSNKSRVQSTMTCYFDWGSMKIIGEELLVECILDEIRARDEKRTRTYYPIPVHIDESAFTDAWGSDGTDHIYEQLLQGKSSPNLDATFTSHEALFAMFIADIEKKNIELPLGSHYLAMYQNREWSIS